MKLNFLTVFLLAVACFRLTRLLVFDKITEFIRQPFFNEIEEVNKEGEVEVYLVPKKEGVRHFFGELLSCYWCSGIWAATGLVGFYYIYPNIATPIILILAVAGIGSALETLIQYLLERK